MCFVADIHYNLFNDCESCYIYNIILFLFLGRHATLDSRIDEDSSIYCESSEQEGVNFRGLIYPAP